MLGMVARRSTVLMSQGRSLRGEYSLIISAVATETGTAMTMATSAMAKDPIRRDNTPKWWASGAHVESVKMLKPPSLNAG